MASAVACRGTTLASLLKKLLAEPSASGAPVAYYALRPAAVTAARRPYNTQGTEVRRYDDGDESSDDSGREYEDADAGDRRRTRDFFSQGMLDPLGAPTTLDRLLSLMDDTAAPSRWTNLSSSTAAPRRGWWVAKDDDDMVELKVLMPGLGKEHVKVWAEQNCLVIKGEGEKEPGEGDDGEAWVPRYSRRIEVAADAFKMDQIKAEMKNGVLRVTVPRVKEEERKDVFQVKVE